MVYKEAVEYISSKNKFGAGTGDMRGEYILNMLGHPENNFKVIHVAGTNGKGSVCAYLSNILIENGSSVGLFTSPHLVKVNERIQINNIPVSDELFTEAFNVMYEIEELYRKDSFGEVTFFDYMFGIAMYIFAKMKVEYVVLETGLGGRLDTTNAIKSPLVSVITSISLDHTEVLGDTLTEIATEKAGIIKEYIPVVYLKQDLEVSKVIEKIADEKNSMVSSISSEQWEIVKNNGKHIDFLVHNGYYKSDVFTISTPAKYQVMNCVIALTVIKVIEKTLCHTFKTDAIRRGVVNTFWEGRMEEIMEGIYIDGAHNPDGIRNLMETVRSLRNESECSLLFSVVKDKHYEQMIKTICESGNFDNLIITQLEGVRKLENQEILKQFKAYTDRPVIVFDTVEEAFDYCIMKRQSGILVCAGSLYLVGKIKQIVAKK